MSYFTESKTLLSLLQDWSLCCMEMSHGERLMSLSNPLCLLYL